MAQLDAIAPRFAVLGDRIRILTLPLEFYSTLKAKILAAKLRVFLSSLYVGKGQQELVDTISQALLANPDLQVYILTDALRGTREAPKHHSLAALLLQLVTQFGSRVDVRMYHTPHLSGVKKSWAPKRLNEGFGLQHMKLYGFDDEIMLSGANLSEDYFSNRQDRYYLFDDAQLTNYYFGVHLSVASLLYKLQESRRPHKFQTFDLVWPLLNRLCEPLLNLQRFILDLLHLLSLVVKQHSLGSFEELKTELDTYVYPVSQFTPLMQHDNDLLTEKPAVLRLLLYLNSPTIKWWFTAGYFNMHPQIQERLLGGAASGTVITASAKANSFYKSLGLLYYLPMAYLLIAKRFLTELHKRGKESLIQLYEWLNGEVNTPGGWLYHAKGIWITVPDEHIPSVSVIGSSNYTKRAYSLDLESNAVVVTKNEDLKQRMAAEVNNLMTHARPLQLEDFASKPLPSEEGSQARYAVDEERRISYGVHLALKVFGGKL